MNILSHDGGGPRALSWIVAAGSCVVYYRLNLLKWMHVSLFGGYDNNQWGKNVSPNWF